MNSNQARLDWIPQAVEIGLAILAWFLPDASCTTKIMVTLVLALVLVLSRTKVLAAWRLSAWHHLAMILAPIVIGVALYLGCGAAYRYSLGFEVTLSYCANLAQIGMVYGLLIGLPLELAVFIRDFDTFGTVSSLGCAVQGVAFVLLMAAAYSFFNEAPTIEEMTSFTDLMWISVPTVLAGPAFLLGLGLMESWGLDPTALEDLAVFLSYGGIVALSFLQNAQFELVAWAIGITRVDHRFLSEVEGCMPAFQAWNSLRPTIQQTDLCSTWLPEARRLVYALYECWKDLPTPRQAQLTQARTSLIDAGASYVESILHLETWCYTGSHSDFDAAVEAIKAADASLETAKNLLSPNSIEFD